MPRKPVKRKVGRSKEWTDEEIITALKLCKGIVTEACRKLGCSRQLISVRKRENPEIKKVIREARADIAGKAARNIYEAVYDDAEPERQLEISKWLARTKFMEKEGYKFDEVKKIQHGEDKDNPLPKNTTQVNLISIHDLPLEQRQLLYEQVKQIQQAKEQTNPTEDV